MASDAASHWSRDGTSNRWHLALGALVAGWAIVTLYVAETVAWGAVAVGFVTFAIAAGPVAASSIGSRVGAWFRGIGYAGRAAVIVGFAVAIWGLVPLVDVSAVRVTGFGVGGMLGTVAVVAVEAVRSAAART